MASAWGNSWGSSWGDSWGAVLEQLVYELFHARSQMRDTHAQRSAIVLQFATFVLLAGAYAGRGSLVQLFIAYSALKENLEAAGAIRPVFTSTSKLIQAIAGSSEIK
jgi:hypothetical protein